MRGGGAKTFWNFSKNSSDLVAGSFPYTYLVETPYIFNVYLSMNILCINICQRPDWVIVLWTKIAPENNSIRGEQQTFYLDALLMTAPTTSSAKESHPSMSRDIQPCCGDYLILYCFVVTEGLFNTEVFPSQAYSSPPTLAPQWFLCRVSPPPPPPLARKVFTSKSAQLLPFMN